MNTREMVSKEVSDLAIGDVVLLGSLLKEDGSTTYYAARVVSTPLANTDERWACDGEIIGAHPLGWDATDWTIQRRQGYPVTVLTSYGSTYDDAPDRVTRITD